MASLEKNARKIDYQKSSLWAISSLGSFGVGPFGAQLFHLVNRESHRAHRFELLTLGAGLAPVPFSGSMGRSDYENFRTPREVNFFDWDGTHMTVRETNAALYSWTTLSFWGMSVKIADGGANVPGVGVSHGKVNIIFGNGKPHEFGKGEVELAIKMPSTMGEQERNKRQPTTTLEDVEIIRIPGDLLFAYNRHHLKPGDATERALADIRHIWVNDPEFRHLIVGHTDSIGSNEYNNKLSKRRAETVASWVKAHVRGVTPAWIKAVGEGKSKPIASNETKEGRAQNRRVEIFRLLTKYWESY